MSIVLHIIGRQISGLTTLQKTRYSSYSHPYYSMIGKDFSPERVMVTSPRSLCYIEMGRAVHPLFVIVYDRLLLEIRAI
jgi:hypothetical protein